MDPLDELRKLVGDTGEVIPEYGGYEVTVMTPEVFPWHQVIRLLFGAGQEIWINDKDGKICIATEHRVE